MIAVQSEAIDVGAALALFAEGAGGAGAIVSFTGLVRPENDGAAVTELALDHYPGFTESAIAAIALEAERRFGLIDLAIVHRHGAMAPGETVVFVAAAAAHRRAAFEAAQYVMDRLKTEAPFWKREVGPGGARWIEARAADLESRGRWE
ncbi:MAG TPA: molybdenum cofactor biosynthesis protein MoaE [Allosphingosinicella sp.]|nr:molybdenum cofactor biosynthesis protein MoaE [Allosphingosinicella sp.]